MEIDKLADGPLPKGANFRVLRYINVQVLPPKLVEYLGEGDVVVMMQRVEGTGDVRLVATRYGKPIEAPAVKP